MGDCCNGVIHFISCGQLRMRAVKHSRRTTSHLCCALAFVLFTKLYPISRPFRRERANKIENLKISSPSSQPVLFGGTSPHGGMPTGTNQNFPKIKTRTPTSCTRL